MDRQLEQKLQQRLGEPIASARPLAGGDINDAYLVELGSGRRFFVKTKRDASPGMYTTEARGLNWLRQSAALRIPEVVDVCDEPPRFLVLEYLPSATRCSDFDAKLGRGLAQLHRSGAERFGLDHDNYLGPLAQLNTPRSSWAEFYVECRLEPQLKQAVEAGRIAGPLQRRFERLFARMVELCGPEEQPARLHGDLWGGNLHVGPNGEPCLIDPAVYGGCREIDLAMMRLFGGFGPGVFVAYEQEFPLPDGAQERVPLYQLYPLLVHVNVFGGGYVGSVERALSQLV